MDPIRLEYGNLMGSRVTDGIDRARLAGDLAGAFESAMSSMNARRATDRVPPLGR